jgi:hypothetical protein
MRRATAEKTFIHYGEHGGKAGPRNAGAELLFSVSCGRGLGSYQPDRYTRAWSGHVRFASVDAAG